MHTTQIRMRDAVKNLFNEKKVDLVIGYENGSLTFRSRPCFVYSAEEAEKLVWNSYCTNNLAVYLPQFFPPPLRIGIVAKGCDARSVVGLVKEKQVPRGDVIIIGMPCQGMVDSSRIKAALDGTQITDCREGQAGMIEVRTSSGEKKQLNRNEVMAEACLECFCPSMEGADVKVEGEAKAGAVKKYERVTGFEARSPEEKWKYFTGEISKCIRCYACRQACPNCYCKVCFAEQTKPRWVGASDNLSELIVYQIGRIFHQAGRCVECDACVTACPMGIDLRLFTQKSGKDVKELFDYVPGMEAGQPPPLCTFKQDDSDSFITEPEEG